ncbi:alpha/beta hydrolase [Streptococcus ovuberis]|uniref:Alpha/beta hydrolase n=1 Tax=Streptococcus ovuberis TaxID=1936207 RepID=A0A7X6N152_9STRE|nr:alpha/beta hydrolase [Streptococcus ovuberis]NKZ20287.1 alpha/beta hydrolase [Streptococcus ovuberis]
MALRENFSKKARKWGLILVSLFLSLLLIGYAYLIIKTYRPTALAYESLETAQEQTTSYSYFEPKQANTEKQPLIFYGGGLVDSQSYSYLAHQLADQGYPVYLLHSPLNLPILGQDQALDLIEEKNLHSVYLIGHSLGGVVASGDALEGHPDISGLILLASYPASSVDLSKTEDLAVLSITASQDKVLNWQQYEKSKPQLPPKTSYMTIEGGNHSGFGLYGQQSGDGQATITPQEQQEWVSQEIHRFIQNSLH